jgi:hypothetical protein
MRSAPLSLVLVLFTTATGCVLEPAMPLEPAEQAPYEPIAEPTTTRDVVVSYDSPAPAEEPPDVVVAPAPAPPRFYPPDPALFRIGAGYGVLGQIDFAPCRDQGLEKGYLHMRVTFRHSGHVVRASVERPAPPPDEALACIAQQLQVAMVPVFDGDDVTLSRSYFVN